MMRQGIEQLEAVPFCEFVTILMKLWTREIFAQ
jgi:hypothetical protein